MLAREGWRVRGRGWEGEGVDDAGLERRGNGLKGEWYRVR
jgi:hypothetical protein